MIHRTLGSTGLSVSPIGLGTVKLGRDQQVRYPTPFELPDDHQAARLLSTAQDLGINLLDTAPAYGRSEERLGQLLRGRRDEWIICTKVGEEFEDGRSHFDFSPQWTRASIERSCARLKTDHLDIVLMHSDGRDRWILEDSGALQALVDARKSGLIRAIGISAKTLDGALYAIECCDVIMVTLNQAETRDAPAIAAAADRGVGVLIKKALQSGHAPLRAMTARDETRTGVESDLAFVFGHRGVSSVIIGTINPDHLRDNVASAERVLAGSSPDSAPGKSS